MVYLNEILFLGPGLFRTILVIAVIYFLIRFFKRVVSPMFNPPQQRPGNFQDKDNRREGDVRVEKDRKRKSNIQEDEGEYVDFEEID